MPPSYNKQDCQGISKRNRGNPLDNNVTKEMGGQFSLCYFQARLFNMNAGKLVGEKGSDGMTYIKQNGSFTTVREGQFTIVDDGSTTVLTTYRFERPGGNGSISLHALASGVARFYGVDEKNEFHHRGGGILEGVLNCNIGPYKPADTWQSKFDLSYRERSKASLVAEFGDELMPENCDVDHCHGREAQKEQSSEHTQGLQHSQNIKRSYDRHVLNDWCDPLYAAPYNGGNESASYEPRIIDTSKHVICICK